MSQSDIDLRFSFTTPNVLGAEDKWEILFLELANRFAHRQIARGDQIDAMWLDGEWRFTTTIHRAIHL